MTNTGEQPSSETAWAPPAEVIKPLTVEEAYADGLRPDAHIDDMKMIVTEPLPPKAGDTVFIRRTRGEIEKWRLSDRVNVNGRPIVENIEPVYVDGKLEDNVDRPINPSDLTVAGQFDLERAFAAQNEKAEALARLTDARVDVDDALKDTEPDDIDNMKVFVNLPKTHVDPNYLPQTTPDRPPSVQSDLENARMRKITVINAQPVAIEEPKKPWFK
jgi:hypothetical protein